MKYLILAVILIPNLIFAQVGVGTTSPQETLDVNGSLRISNINKSLATKVVGTDANGTINEIVVGDNLEMIGGSLNATGSTKYFVQTLPFPTTSSGHQFHNVSLDLNGFNKDKTVFRISGAMHGFEFTGISGGTDGKHIVLVNVSAENFKLPNEHTGSIAQNRILTLAGGFEQTAGQGVAELVYDGSLQRWIIFNFRN